MLIFLYSTELTVHLLIMKDTRRNGRWQSIFILYSSIIDMSGWALAILAATIGMLFLWPLNKTRVSKQQKTLEVSKQFPRPLDGGLGGIKTQKERERTGFEGTWVERWNKSTSIRE
jgi:hypothetical protein